MYSTEKLARGIGTRNREIDPKLQLQSYLYQNPVPEKYRKKFVHTDDGFVKKFCEDYDERKD